MSPPHVLIVGAGLGGLTLAQGLKRNNIPFTVFERDPTRHSRSQGYRIRIHHQGPPSLRSNLPSEVFTLFERTCGAYNLGGARIDLSTGSPDEYMEGKDIAGDNSSEGKYNVDRATFRAVLMTGIEENIQFGKTFKSFVDIDGGKRVRVDFVDGSSAEGDFLVAADGTRSQVRQQVLPDFAMVETEARCVYGKTFITPELTSRYPEKAMKYMTLARHPSTPLCLFLEPMMFSEQPSTLLSGVIPEVKDYVYWVMIIPSKTAHGLDDKEFLLMSGEPLAKASLKMAEDNQWHESMRSLIELQDPASAGAIRILSTLPPIKSWEAKGNMTLLGDAIHPMSPTGGAGANTAIEDAADLCKCIVEGITLEGVRGYESRMRERCDKWIMMSLGGAQKMFGQKPYTECERV